MVMQHLPTPYAFNDQGFFCGGVRLSNYILVPRRMFCHPGESSPFCFTISVLVAGQSEQILEPYFPLSELTPRWWKTPPAGCWIYPGAKHADSHLALVFHSLLHSLEPQELICVEDLGWHTLPNGLHVYVTGTDFIGACGGTNLRISPALALFRLEQLSGRSPEDAMQYFWRLYDLVPGISDVLLATTISSFLIPMFQKSGLHTWFSVMLEGPTESKKTTLAVLTSGLYTRLSAPRSCVLSLTSTGSALERRLGQMRHCTVVCDDLFPDGGTTQQNLVRSLIRDQANQTPRESVSGGSILTYVRESGLVFTVEKAPLSCQSTDSRCLRLILDTPISNDRISTVQDSAALLGNVWHLFLEQTAAHYEELEQFVADEFAHYRRSRMSSTGPERLPEIEAILYIAVASFLKLFPTADSEERLDRLAEHLNHWAEISGSQKSIFQAIQEIHDTNPNYFFDRRDCWCITRECLTALLRDYLGDYSLSERTVTAMLYQRRALQTDRSGERTKKIHGQRCLCIIPEQLLELS